MVNNIKKIAATVFIITSILIINHTVAVAQNTKSLASIAIKSTVSIKMLSPYYGSYIQGSGFVVGKDIIATNYHVISLAKEGFVQKSATDSTRLYIKRILSVDVENDLALLEIPGLNLPVLELSSSTLEVGEKVYVCGNPLGLSGTFSDGLVSANREIEDKEIIQITAPVSHGSSGGPVLNETGKVIGVIFSTMEEGQNLNFVIPANKLKKLLNSPFIPFNMDFRWNGTSNTDSMEVVLYEKFNDPKTTKLSGLSLNKKKNSIYLIKEAQEHYIFSRNARNFKYFPNFEIKGVLKMEPGNEGCLYWGNLEIGNDVNTYQVEYYRLCLKNKNGWVDLTNTDHTTSIKSPVQLKKINENDFNTFSVLKLKDSLYFKINNETVTKTAYVKNPGNHVGFGGSGPTAIEIDYVQLKQSKPEINTDSAGSYKISPVIQSQNHDILESSPVISPDGNKMYLTHYEYVKKQSVVNVYSVDLNKPVKTSVKETAFSDGVGNYLFGVSYDGNTFFVEKAQNGKGYHMEHYLYSYDRINGIRNDFPAISQFYKMKDYSVFYISGDGKYLIHSLNRYDSFGKEDLFVSKKMPNGTYSAPLNLGPIINSEFREGSACLTADQNYIIFASNGHPGYGKSDLFISKRLDSTWVRWSRPVNLGPEINTKEDENDPTINITNNELYFVRADSLSRSVYKTALPSKYEPNVTYAEFTLDEKLSALSDISVEITDSSAVKMKNIFSVTNRDKFQWVFDNGKIYHITLTANGETVIDKKLNLSKVSKFNISREKLAANH